MVRLAVDSVAKSFGDVVALDDVTFTVGEAELIAIIGPSGSGKSTLLRTIAGLERPDSGSVAIDGIEVEVATPWSNGVAMVFQDEALYEHLTVGGNLSFPLLVSGAGKEYAGKRADEQARTLGIRRLMPRSAKTLSSGERGLVATGRALTRESLRLLLLDEPLAKADLQVRNRFRSQLVRLQRELGVTTLLATNEQEDAMAVADRLVVLIDGRVAQIGPPLEVFDAPVSTTVAGFVGTLPMNLLPAHVGRAGDRWVLEIGRDTVHLDQQLPGSLDNRQVIVGVHPHEMRVASPETQFQHTLKVTVGLVEDLGGSSIVRFGLGPNGGVGFAWTERSGRRFEPGHHCELTWDRSRLRLFDSETGAAIDLAA